MIRPVVRNWFDTVAGFWMLPWRTDQSNQDRKSIYFIGKCYTPFQVNKFGFLRLKKSGWGCYKAVIKNSTIMAVFLCVRGLKKSSWIFLQVNSHLHTRLCLKWKLIIIKADTFVSDVMFEVSFCFLFARPANPRDPQFLFLWDMSQGFWQNLNNSYKGLGASGGAPSLYVQWIGWIFKQIWWCFFECSRFCRLDVQNWKFSWILDTFLCLEIIHSSIPFVLSHSLKKHLF